MVPARGCVRHESGDTQPSYSIVADDERARVTKSSARREVPSEDTAEQPVGPSSEPIAYTMLGLAQGESLKMSDEQDDLGHEECFHALLGSVIERIERAENRWDTP